MYHYITVFRYVLTYVFVTPTPRGGLSQRSFPCVILSSFGFKRAYVYTSAEGALLALIRWVSVCVGGCVHRSPTSSRTVENGLSFSGNRYCAFCTYGPRELHAAVPHPTEVAQVSLSRPQTHTNGIDGPLAGSPFPIRSSYLQCPR